MGQSMENTVAKLADFSLIIGRKKNANIIGHMFTPKKSKKNKISLIKNLWIHMSSAS